MPALCRVRADVVVTSGPDRITIGSRPRSRRRARTGRRGGRCRPPLLRSRDRERRRRSSTDAIPPAASTGMPSATTPASNSTSGPASEPSRAVLVTRSRATPSEAQRRASSTGSSSDVPVQPSTATRPSRASTATTRRSPARATAPRRKTGETAAVPTMTRSAPESSAARSRQPCGSRRPPAPAGRPRRDARAGHPTVIRRTRRPDRRRGGVSLLRPQTAARARPDRHPRARPPLAALRGGAPLARRARRPPGSPRVLVLSR